MEVPAVTDRALSGLDSDRLRLSSMADGSDYVDDTAQKEEKSPEEIEGVAKSLGAVKFYFSNETGEGIKEEQKTPEKSIGEDIEIQEDGSDCADDIAKRKERAPEVIEEEASGLRATKSIFSNENVDEEETNENSHIEDSGETIQKEESTPQKSVTEEDMKIKEDATSFRENGLDCADDIALEKIEKDAISLRATESDFGYETLRKEETDETSYVEDSGEITLEENTPEKSVDDEDKKVNEDALSLRANGLYYTDDIALEEENAPEKIEEVATNLRADKSDFANGSHKEDTDENIQKEENSPEKSIIEDPRSQDDKTSLRVESSDCADDTTNGEERARENIQEDATSLEANSSDFAHDHEACSKEETATENIQECATSLGDEGSDFADDKRTHGKEETVGDAKREEKIQDDATRMRAEGSGFVDDTTIEEEKAPHDIQEDSTSFGTVSSGSADKTVLKEETDEEAQEEASISEKLIVEEDKKIQDGAASLRADGSDCLDDTLQAEEKSPVKSTTEQIQEDDTRLKVQKSDLADESAPKEESDENAKKEEKIPERSVVEMDEKIEDVAASLRAEASVCNDDETAQEYERTPVESSNGLIQEDATSVRVQNSDSADVTTHEVSNNHAGVEEPGRKEETTQKESSQANAGPDIPASTSGRTANPAPSAAPSTASPAGLGRAARLLEPAPRVVQQPRVNGTTSQAQTQQIEDSNGETEEYDETREQLQMIRVKFLRLAYRLGQTPHNVVVAQVLYRLGLAEQLRGRNGGRVGAFSFDRASAMAEQLEAAGQEPLDFSCTIMVLGKTGVGKSATINSIFDEQKFVTSAFQMGTQKVQDVIGTVQGIKVRVIDTPGLLSSWSDQRQNVKILNSVKQFIKKNPPDIVLYLDRLDMQSRDFGDMPLLRTITEIFGPSIWFNAIVVLTHAASAPPDGPNGTASSYDMFVTQRSHVVQQSIRQAAGDMRLMNPVSLVENHSACRTNRAGQRVLPNGQVWKPHLLLLSFASKILAEANTLLKLQDNSPGKPSTRSRAPPLPFLLSSLLQSRPPLKLPGEQVVVDEDDLDDSSDSDNETEYDDLPPFTRLTKAQVAMLTKAQKRAYFDELAYREKLFMKKQLKEEGRQRKMMKKMADSGQGMPTESIETVEEESDTAIPPAPMPDLALPASFDSSNPTHRYRCLDSASQWVVRPVLDTHGWDRDVGYEGINVERLFVVKNKLPVSFSGQASKDKKDANIQMEINSSLSHGQGKSTSMGFDLQTVGKDMAYTLRGETKFCNHRRNKATAGLSATVLGDALSTGLKLEDKLIINKCLSMVMAGGAMSGRGDVAYGGSLEAQWRDKDYPIGSFLSTLGLSIMDWHGDLAIGGNIQSQIPIGRSSNLIARANLNNRGAGQINIRFNSSEQLQLALFGLIPLFRKALDRFSQSQYGQQ